MNGSAPPGALGAVLAGGRGSRLGGAKADVALAGRPLLSYALGALAEARLETVVCVKHGEIPRASGAFASSELTKAPRAPVRMVEEPTEPRHPLAGIVAALRWGGGRPVVALACDLPFVEPALIEFLAAAREPLVVPSVDGRPQPLLARYGSSLLPDLEDALRREAPLTRTVDALAPRYLREDELRRFGDPRRLLFNVNTPDELRQAEAILGTSERFG